MFRANINLDLELLAGIARDEFVELIAPEGEQILKRKQKINKEWMPGILPVKRLLFDRLCTLYADRGSVPFLVIMRRFPSLYTPPKSVSESPRVIQKPPTAKT